MTVSVYQSAMSSEDKPESSHEYNFFLDRQLQNKLMDYDEQLFNSENFVNHAVNYVSNVDGKSNKNLGRNEEVTGWIHSNKINFRKPEKENNGRPAKEFIQPWKDYKTKAQLDTFVFKHYTDSRHYIQQYREEHALVVGYRSPNVSRAELGSGDQHLRRLFAAHHGAPSPSINGANTVGPYNSIPHQQHHAQTENHSNTSNNGHSSKNSSAANTASPSPNGQLLTASMHYTNKRENSSLSSKYSNPNKPSHNHHNPQNPNHQCSKHVHSGSDQGYKYKLAPESAWRSESSQSEQTDAMSSRMLSGRNNDLRGKPPTKVMVPAGSSNGIVKPHPLQTVTVQSSKTNHEHSNHVTNTIPSGTVRTLDTLACVAADKQRRPMSSSVQVRTLGHVVLNPTALHGHAIKRPSSSISIVVRKIKSKSEIDLELTSSSDVAGLTWCERLEVLRSVNKKPEKTKSKQPKIRYYKESPNTHEPPGPLFSSRARLYEQRRIKHVLEQTKLRGVDHYEWVSDGGIRRYKVQYSESSDDSSSCSSSEYDEDESIPTTGLRVVAKSLSGSVSASGTKSSTNQSEPVLQRNRVPISVRGGGWKVLPNNYPIRNSHSAQ